MFWLAVTVGTIVGGEYWVRQSGGYDDTLRRRVMLEQAVKVTGVGWAIILGVFALTGNAP